MAQSDSEACVQLGCFFSAMTLAFLLAIIAGAMIWGIQGSVNGHVFVLKLGATS